MTVEEGLHPGKGFFARRFRRRKQELARLRLEQMAEVFIKTRQLLLEAEDIPIDEISLLARTRERACGACPNRRSCRVSAQLPKELLQLPLTENTSLPIACRKPGRMVLEIRRTREQYRLLKADRQRQREYRSAVSQQYLFLAEFLREQSVALSQATEPGRTRFMPEVSCAARSREAENGDKFRHFPGPGGTYFLLLCDGMGTGLGAAEEGRAASSLLHRMLTAGFPPEHALESIHSLLALRGRAGAVTVDLAEISLSDGSAALYKWGAAPSWLLQGREAKKIGTAGPPPGIRGWDIRERRERLSLGRGEWLILCSDGVDGEEALGCAAAVNHAAAGGLAAKLLEGGAMGSADDATVAVVRLLPGEC